MHTPAAARGVRSRAPRGSTQPPPRSGQHRARGAPAWRRPGRRGSEPLCCRPQPTGVITRSRMPRLGGGPPLQPTG
eukprot:scaffold46438_cov51-Phaeocystis_antarctica.AAC.1